MADVCDRASATESLNLAAALSGVTSRQMGRGPLWVEGVPHCRGCEGLISPVRVKALPDVELCIECAKDAECSTQTA